MKFVIATGNPGKVKDFNLLLGKVGHEAVSLKELNIDIDVEEPGTTFQENAYIKAKAIYDIVKIFIQIKIRNISRDKHYNMYNILCIFNNKKDNKL